MPHHHRRVVVVGYHRMRGLQGVGVADHGEQAFILRHAVDGEFGVEDFVTAMLAIGLSKHHQLDITGVAPQLGESGQQIVHLVVGQRQAKVDIGFF